MAATQIPVARKYFRLGRYDIWIGCHGEQVGIVRFEWQGRGLRIYEIVLESKMTVPNNICVGCIEFKCKNGKLQIRITPTQNSKVILDITYKRFFLPFFWVSGDLSQAAADKFINTLSKSLRASGQV